MVGRTMLHLSELNAFLEIYSQCATNSVSSVHRDPVVMSGVRNVRDSLFKQLTLPVCHHDRADCLDVSFGYFLRESSQRCRWSNDRYAENAEKLSWIFKKISNRPLVYSSSWKFKLLNLLSCSVQLRQNVSVFVWVITQFVKCWKVKLHKRSSQVSAIR